METNSQSAAAKKSTGTHNTETRPLLSVKQDLSRMDASNSSVELPPEKSCSGVSSECDEGAEADGAAGVLSDAAVGVTAHNTELDSDHEVQCEHLNDEPQPHKSCDLLSSQLSHTPEKPDELLGSPSSHADVDEFSDSLSSRGETFVESSQFSDSESKAASLKRKPAEHTSSSVDDRHTSSAAKKLRHKTCVPEVSASQFVRTTSGTFVVHDITEPGELSHCASTL